ncbi:hypothetical protein [Sinomicrobium oceani]|uniref:hypothetical protein n=1 Tax=Sinomicrobium oceani TaxID=1150368 RepID=UPI00227BAE48|nr:hypothetical protein [Sinomicrobium oceani]
MNTPHQKLEHLQEVWSAEMATFREQQQIHKALKEELRECLQKLRNLTSLVGLQG